MHSLVTYLNRFYYPIKWAAETFVMTGRCIIIWGPSRVFIQLYFRFARVILEQDALRENRRGV